MSETPTISLRDFAPVHPDWSAFQTLDDDATDKLFQLLLLATLIKGDLTPTERRLLLEDVQLLWPQEPERIHNPLVPLLARTHETVQTIFDDPGEAYSELMDGLGARFSEGALPISVVKLLAIHISPGHATTHQQYFFLEVAQTLGLELDTAQGLLRAAWATWREILGAAASIKPIVTPTARRWNVHDLKARYPNPVLGGPANA